MTLTQELMRLADEAKRLVRLALDSTDDFDDEWRINKPALMLLAKIDNTIAALTASQGESEPVSVSPDADRILRASVPDHWKGCTSPIGSVQSYIAELEQALIAQGVDLDELGESEPPQSGARCKCGEKLAADCDDEWGPNCDLGNNPAYARRAPAESAESVDAALGIVRSAPQTGGAVAQWSIRVVEDEERSWLRLRSPDGREASLSCARGSLTAQILQDYSIAALAALPLPEEAADETAWLVECDGKWPGLGHAGPIQWLAITSKLGGYGACELTLTSDASKALRFARREDAEAAMRMHLGGHDRPEMRAGFTVTEHMWPDLAHPAAPGQAQTEEGQ
jgi:hypothetical protein